MRLLTALLAHPDDQMRAEKVCLSECSRRTVPLMETTRDDAQYLGGRGLLVQCLTQLVGARFELLFSTASMRL